MFITAKHHFSLLPTCSGPMPSVCSCQGAQRICCASSVEGAWAHMLLKGWSSCLAVPDAGEAGGSSQLGPLAGKLQTPCRFCIPSSALKAPGLLCLQVDRHQGPTVHEHWPLSGAHSTFAHPHICRPVLKGQADPVTNAGVRTCHTSPCASFTGSKAAGELTYSLWPPAC